MNSRLLLECHLVILTPLDTLRKIESHWFAAQLRLFQLTFNLVLCETRPLFSEMGSVSIRAPDFESSKNTSVYREYDFIQLVSVTKIVKRKLQFDFLLDDL